MPTTSAATVFHVVVARNKMPLDPRAVPMYLKAGNLHAHPGTAEMMRLSEPDMPDCSLSEQHSFCNLYTFAIYLRGPALSAFQIIRICSAMEFRVNGHSDTVHL